MNSRNEKITKQFECMTQHLEIPKEIKKFETDWNIYLDPEYSSLLFELVDGELYEEPDPIDIVTNASEIVVNAQEREYTEAEAAEAGIDKPENPGQPWDNQLFIKANRILKTGEATVLYYRIAALQG